MIQIREMQKQDAGAVSQLYENSWRRAYEGIIEADQLETEIGKRFSVTLQAGEADDPEIITLVAVDPDDRVVGASLSKMDERNQAWIDRIHVIPEVYGTGVAADLLRATLTKHAGLQSIALKVMKNNTRAIAFYEKHGFAVTGEFERDAQVGGADTLIMTRTISRS